VNDVITAAGRDAAPVVRVFSGLDGALLRAFVAYPGLAPGGTYVAAGDVNGDGVPDIVTGRDGVNSEVRVFDGASNTLISSFLAYDAGVTGVRVAVGDINADGIGEIFTSPPFGSAPEVRGFSAAGELQGSFMAYNPAFTGGVFVAAGDIDGDGRADVITGADAGGGPHVIAYSGADGHVLRSFFAYSPLFPNGVRVAAGDLDLDGRAEIITAAGPGGGPHVRVFDGATGSEVVGFFSGSPADPNGVFVGAATPQPRVAIDTLLPGSVVPSVFTLTGWAAIGGSTTDSGVDAIHVWAVPVAGGPPIFVGATTVGGSRPDVAALLGGVFDESGYTLPVGPLGAGAYDLAVFAHSSRSFTFTAWRIIRITVTP
jgi:hypothetical protein